MGTATVTATGGNYVMTSADSGSLTTGLFIKIDGEAYEIASVDSMNNEFTLVEVSVATMLVLQQQSLPCYRNMKGAFTASAVARPTSANLTSCPHGVRSLLSEFHWPGVRGVNRRLHGHLRYLRPGQKPVHPAINHYSGDAVILSISC